MKNLLIGLLVASTIAAPVRGQLSGNEIVFACQEQHTTGLGFKKGQWELFEHDENAPFFIVIRNRTIDPTQFRGHMVLFNECRTIVEDAPSRHTCTGDHGQSLYFSDETGKGSFALLSGGVLDSPGFGSAVSVTVFDCQKM